METRKKRYENYRKKISMMSDEDAPDYVSPSSFKADGVNDKPRVNEDSLKASSGDNPYLIYKKRRVTSLLLRSSLSLIIVLGLLIYLLVLIL